jgi:hypothetical protein
MTITFKAPSFMEQLLAHAPSIAAMYLLKTEVFQNSALSIEG